MTFFLVEILNPGRRAARIAPDPAPQGGCDAPTLGAGHDPVGLVAGGDNV